MEDLRTLLLAMVLDANAPPAIAHRAEEFLDKWEPRVREAAQRHDPDMTGLRAFIDVAGEQGGAWIIREQSLVWVPWPVCEHTTAAEDHPERLLMVRMLRGTTIPDSRGY